MIDYGDFCCVSNLFPPFSKPVTANASSDIFDLAGPSLSNRTPQPAPQSLLYLHLVQISTANSISSASQPAATRIILRGAVLSCSQSIIFMTTLTSNSLCYLAVYDPVLASNLPPVNDINLSSIPIPHCHFSSPPRKFQDGKKAKSHYPLTRRRKFDGGSHASIGRETVLSHKYSVYHSAYLTFIANLFLLRIKQLSCQ